MMQKRMCCDVLIVNPTQAARFWATQIKPNWLRWLPGNRAMMTTLWKVTACQLISTNTHREQSNTVRQILNEIVEVKPDRASSLWTEKKTKNRRHITNAMQKCFSWGNGRQQMAKYCDKPLREPIETCLSSPANCKAPTWTNAERRV